MIREHDQVVVTGDVAELPVRAGDLGTVVHVYRDGQAYEVEFASLSGKTIGVATLEAAHIREIGEGEIAHARLMAA
jgi:hypothetical protein